MLVLWTLAAVAIILFAALAIDLGNIAQTKRKAQNTADDAAVSAVGDLAGIFTDSTNYATYEQTAVTDAETYVQENDTSVLSADWSSSTKCPTMALTGVTASTQTQCIGFFNPQNSSLNLSEPTGIVVVIPGRVVNYTLGKVGGLTTQGVSALAYASIQTANANNVLPFGYSVSGSSGLQCLKTSNPPATCSGFTTGSGNFGLICSPRFTLFVNGTCSSGNDVLTEGDMAIGLDHVLHCYQSPAVLPYCTSGSQIVDSSKSNLSGMSTNYCSPYNTANYANPSTGQTDSIVSNGLFLGFSGSFQSTPNNSPSGCGINNASSTTYTFSPRLNHPDGVSATSTSSSDACPSCPGATPTSPLLSASNGDTFGSSYSLNGVQLTKYLIPNSGSSDPKTNAAFTSCYTGTKPGGGTPDPSSDAIDEQVSGTYVWASGDTCFSTLIQAQNPNTPLFSSDIEKSPRFGIVPLISTTGSGPVPIQGFDAVYLDLAYPKNSGGGANTVGALQAWVFPLTLVQDVSLGNSSGFGSFIGGPFVANLCDLPAGNC